jgi:hypothetical protein
METHVGPRGWQLSSGAENAATRSHRIPGGDLAPRYRLGTAVLDWRDPRARGPGTGEQIWWSARLRGIKSGRTRRCGGANSSAGAHSFEGGEASHDGRAYRSLTLPNPGTGSRTRVAKAVTPITGQHDGRAEQMTRNRETGPAIISSAPRARQSG